MIRAVPAPARDAVLLIARVVVGVVLIAHGAQKFFSFGIGGTAAAFGQMGIPLAPVAAVYAAVVELAGGVLLIAGAATALVGLLVAIDMLGAILFVHIGNGVFVTDNGWELTGVILAAALAFAAVGAGRFSVDHVLAERTEAPVAA